MPDLRDASVRTIIRRLFKDHGVWVKFSGCDYHRVQIINYKPLRSLFRSVCADLGVDKAKVQFWHKGICLDWEDTPLRLGLANDAVIVMFTAIGSDGGRRWNPHSPSTLSDVIAAVIADMEPSLKTT